MLSDKISRLTGFAFVACRSRSLSFPFYLVGKREAGVEFPLPSVGGGGVGMDIFLALHNVILFKNKVNRKQPKTGKPGGTSL